jgi:hypothetical protein
MLASAQLLLQRNREVRVEEHMPELSSQPLSWKQIADLCRSHLEPDEIRQLDIHVWQELLIELRFAAGLAGPPANGYETLGQSPPTPSRA